MDEHSHDPGRIVHRPPGMGDAEEEEVTVEQATPFQNREWPVFRTADQCRRRQFTRNSQ
jgi:hypothetical protein